MAEGDGGSIINVSSTAADPRRAERHPLRRGQGRPQRDDRRLRARVRAEGARELHHARPVPHRHLEGVEHGAVRAAGEVVRAQARRRSRTRSSAPRSTSPATRRPSPPAASSRSTAARGRRWPNVLAVDLGASSVRVAVVDLDARPLDAAHHPPVRARPRHARRRQPPLGLDTHRRRGDARSRARHRRRRRSLRSASTPGASTTDFSTLTMISLSPPYAYRDARTDNWRETRRPHRRRPALPDDGHPADADQHHLPARGARPR